MPSSRARATGLLSAIALILMAWSASQAGAIVGIEGSRITAPADPTYALDDTTLPESLTAFTVQGVTEGSGNVDINCYFAAGSPKKLATNVAVAGNAFSVAIPQSELPLTPCALRAVPTGSGESYPPGSSTQFQGIQLASSWFEVFTNSSTKVNYDFEVEAYTLSAYMDIESAGDCGLDYSALYTSGSLAESDKFFDCNAALYQSDDPPTGSATRSEIQIDGKDAYDTAAANSVYQNVKPSTPPPSITVTKSFDSATGLITIHEIEPLVECASTSTNPEIYPPTSESCETLKSAGVQLERSWQQTNAGQVAYMTDTWHSTDGQGHTVNAHYDQEIVNHKAPGGAYEFPGRSEFAETKAGESVSLPSGANTILFKEDSATPDAGDLEHPQGAIVYDSSPSAAVGVYRGSGESSYNGFIMPYQRTIPAGGSSTLRMAFVQAYGLAEVRSLAGAAIASYHPSVSIASPTNGASTASPTIAVSGVASDSVALSSLTVNGQAVAVGAGGAWSTTVALTPGANTITATATNEAGLTVSAAVTVTYSPAPPAARASQVGTASGANGKVTLTLACAGSPGTACHVQVAVTTVEKLHGKKVFAVVAKTKTRSKKVVVATSSVTIPAGSRVKLTIGLNATGRKLLARFHKLPGHLSATLTGTTRTTIVAQNLTIKPAHKKKKKHKH